MKVTSFDVCAPNGTDSRSSILPASLQESVSFFIFLSPSKLPSLLAVTHVGVLCNPTEHAGMQSEYKMLQVIKFIRVACHYFCIIIQLLQLWKVINHCTGDKLRS